MNRVAEHLLDRSLAQGAEEVEVFLSRGTEFTVKAYQGQVESLVAASSRGFGLRTLREHRVGFAYTSDSDRAALDGLVDEALRNGRYNHADEANVLPETAPAPELGGLVSPRFESADPQRKIQFALDLERRAIAIDRRVRRVSNAVYSDGSGHVEIYNSRGLEAQFDRTVAYGVVDVIAEQDSEMQSGFAFTHGRDLESLDLDAAATEAVQNAAGLLGARPVPTASVPVVLHPHAAAMIPITDDARLPDGLASRPFDGEGVASQRNELIRDGVLQGYLHNTYTARRTKGQSTGSAVRSYKSVPEVGVSNLVLTPGSISREALLQRVGNGLHVSQLHGLNTVNPVSGDFSLGLTGHWIDNGQLTKPVRELTVAGNLIELLKRVVTVASDLRFIFAGGFCGSPTVLIEELPVGGT